MVDGDDVIDVMDHHLVVGAAGPPFFDWHSEYFHIPGEAVLVDEGNVLFEILFHNLRDLIRENLIIPRGQGLTDRGPRRNGITLGVVMIPFLLGLVRA